MDILVNGKIIEPSDNEAVNNLIMSAFEVEEVLYPNTDKKIRYRPRSTPHNPIGVCNCSMCAPSKMYRGDTIRNLKNEISYLQQLVAVASGALDGLQGGNNSFKLSDLLKIEKPSETRTEYIVPEETKSILEEYYAKIEDALNASNVEHEWIMHGDIGIALIQNEDFNPPKDSNGWYFHLNGGYHMVIVSFNEPDNFFFSVDGTQYKVEDIIYYISLPEEIQNLFM